MRCLSLAQARRVALASQGFTDPSPRGRVDVRHLRRVVARVDLIQIDSVNVLERAHYLPALSRLGPYPRGLLDDLAYRRGELFEYWGHEASLVPVADQPLYRARMARMAEPSNRERRLIDSGLMAAVEAEVAERGPLLASEVHPPRNNRGPWWDWHDGKVACEYLLASGRFAVAARRNFARVYDLAERVLPAEVLGRPTPAPDDALRTLLAKAGRALGVATLADLADYHRIRRPLARPLVGDLVADGVLEPVAVEGWGEPAYLHVEARLPRRVEARALLAPFDPLVWFRPRAERLFGFRYRLEIYVPAAQRVHGYYVLPFLLGDRLVARADLKADRRAGRLLVRSAWLEPGHDPAAVAAPLAAELAALAGWLGLVDVAVAERGDLAPALRAAALRA